MRPKLEISTATEQTFDFIEQYLNNSDIKYKRFQINQISDLPSESSIIETYVQGQSDYELVLVIPVDGKSYSDDNSAAIAMGLTLLTDAAGAENSLRVLFTGGHSGTTEQHPLGLRAYLDNFNLSVNKSAVILLKLTGMPSSLDAVTASTGEVTPLWLTNYVKESFQSIPLNLFDTLNQSVRLGFEGPHKGLGILLKQEYHSIQLISRGTGDIKNLHSMYADLNKAFAMIHTQWTGKWDRHYIIASFFGYTFFISESVYLFILIFMLWMPLGYGIFITKRTKRYKETISHNFWNIPLFLIFIYAFVLFSGFIIETLGHVQGNLSLWELYPGFYLAIKLSTAVFLYSMLTNLVSHLPFSRNGSFYSALAIILSYTNTLIIAFFNISFSYYFLWAFWWIFIYSLVRNKWLKLAFLILAPILLIQVLFQIVWQPALELVDLLLHSTLWGNLLLAGILLPFILLLVRQNFLFKHPRKGRRSLLLTLITIVSGSIAIGVSIFLFTVDPYANRSQPLSVTEVVNSETGEYNLYFNSPAAIGELAFDYKDFSLKTQLPNNKYTIEDSYSHPILDVAFGEKRFLGRRTVDISIDANIQFQEFELELTSETGILLYDANFPYTVSPDGINARISLGAVSKFPVQLKLTIPQETAYTWFINGRSLDIATQYAVKTPGFEINEEMILREEIHPPWQLK